MIGIEPTTPTNRYGSAAPFHLIHLLSVYSTWCLMLPGSAASFHLIHLLGCLFNMFDASMSWNYMVDHVHYYIIYYMRTFQKAICSHVTYTWLIFILRLLNLAHYTRYPNLYLVNWVYYNKEGKNLCIYLRIAFVLCRFIVQNQGRNINHIIRDFCMYKSYNWRFL